MQETIRTSTAAARFGYKSLRPCTVVCFFSFLIVCDNFLIAQSNDLRTWQDLSGKFSVQAALETVTDKEVTLKKPDGQTVVMPRGRLSKNDQEFVIVFEVLKVIASQATKPQLPSGSIASRLTYPNAAVPFDLLGNR